MRNLGARLSYANVMRSLLAVTLATGLAAPQAMANEPPFAGKIAMERKDSIPAWPEPVRAPAGAPNVVLIMLDDVGFGAAGTFGGAIPTPALSALADQGLKYNNFHTTGVCSPSRAALLTGRNAHRVGIGMVNGGESGFPGYNGIWKPQMASVAQVLRTNGYATAAFGKWHNTPLWETGPTGPFDRWPTGLGFDYFYGFQGGQASQWQPFLHRGTVPVDPDVTTRPGYNFNTDMANDAISWMHTQTSIAPERPYFLFFTPGAAHAPLHVGLDWSAKFKGQFDDGWDKLRETTFARQKKLGVIPKDAVLTPRPANLPAWSSLTADQKRLYARQMEVFAGFLAQTDYEVGRLIEAVRKAPGGENTIVMYIVGDNGGSTEGGLDGSDTNTADAFNGGKSAPVAHQLARAGLLGTDLFDNHYAAPWAWATDAPFPWAKQVASHLGGIRNPMVLSWPARIKAAGLRTQFAHVNDVVPTLYDVIGITPPAAVNGVEQASFDGQSFAPTIADAKAPSPPRVQYFEVMGNRSIYKDGWLASAKHADPWTIFGRSENFRDDPWELYNLNVDFSQSKDLAKQEPAKLAEMQALFDSEARRNDVYPLGNFPGVAKGTPSPYHGRTRIEFPGDVWPMAARDAPILSGSHSITAHLTVPAGGGEGVIVSQGGRYGGFSFYVQDGKLTYQANAFGKGLSTVQVKSTLPEGRIKVTYRFEKRGEGIAAGGTASFYVNDVFVGSGPLAQYGPPTFMDAFCIGRDCGTAPGDDYKPPFAFTGKVEKVILDTGPPPAKPAP